MALVDGYGLSTAQATALGQGTLLQGGKGVASTQATALGQGTLLYGAQGVGTAIAAAFGHLVELVEVVSVAAVTSTKIRVTFDRGMFEDAALLAPGSYALTPVTSGAAIPVITSVEAQNLALPTFVDLITTEHTDGASYTCTVSTSGPTDPEGTPVDPAADSDTYTGLGIAPTIKRVAAIGANRADVVFDEPMTDNVDIRNAAKYGFSGGLTVIAVLDAIGDTVKLVTSDQDPGVSYTLTIS